jgi:hypothetical protein
MYLMDENITDAISLVREVARSVMWDIMHTEQSLEQAHKNLECAREMIKRLGLDEQALLDDEQEGDDDDDDAETYDEFVRKMIVSRHKSFPYYEANLKRAHNAMAVVKMMLARGKYTEINLAEIQKQLEEQQAKRDAQC